MYISVHSCMCHDFVSRTVPTTLPAADVIGVFFAQVFTRHAPHLPDIPNQYLRAGSSG